jgi:hypothetical protein
MANDAGNAQTLINHIRNREENPVIIPNGELMKLLGLGNDVYRYQQLRYEIPFLVSDIILERQTSNYIRKEKQPFGFKKLTPEEAKTYQLTSINFRYLTDKQIQAISSLLPKEMSNKDKFRTLLIIDILIGKNPQNQWCTIAKNLFPSFLAASEDEIQMLFDVLLDKKILYKAQIKGNVIFKLALSESERQEIEHFLSTDSPVTTQQLQVVNVNTTRTRPVQFIRKTSKSIKASDAVDLSSKCAIIENKKTNVRENTETTFDEALKVLVDCYRDKEHKLEVLQQDNAKSHEIFETMNANYVEKSDELRKLQAESENMASAKKKIRQNVPHVLDQLTARLLDLLMEFTTSPVSIESTNQFKSNMLAAVMDTQQSIKNLMPK